MPADQDISVTALFERHWVAMLATPVICIALAALVTTIMPRRYESTMKFLVNNERARPGDYTRAQPSRSRRVRI